MKKKIIGLLLCAVLVMSSGMSVCAAAGFDMEYLPGTGDTVTNMPDADSGVGGQPYTVSAKVPERTGYEFLYWTLYYGIADTYTLKYQVTGDLKYGKPGDATEPAAVTGIPAGGSVTLANALSTAWVTSDGSPAPTKASYTVYYIDNATNVELLPSKNDTNQIGSTVTEEAIDIAGWTVVDGVSKSLTLKPDKEGKWTFTGWCSDEACTMPITEVTNINADITVYGKWVYSETENNNEITFYYEEMPEYTSYVVRYIDRTTGNDIADPKIRNDQKVGGTVTEEAVASEKYDLDDDSSKSLTLKKDNNEIFFYYKPAVANYTVRYVDVTDGEYVDITDENGKPYTEYGTGNVGSTVTKTRRVFNDYTYLGTSTRAKITLTRDDDKNVIIFEYVQKI